MKIKLNFDIPVDEAHGLTEGKILETIKSPQGKERLKGVWVQGNDEPVRILNHEYEDVK